MQSNVHEMNVIQSDISDILKQLEYTRKERFKTKGIAPRRNSHFHVLTQED